MKRVKSSDEERDLSMLAVDQYLRQVSWIPPLTDEEQEQLVGRIERGKAEQGKACPDATVLEDAKAARDRFIEGFQRLVIFLARGWLHSFRGMELLDLVQEGNLGLLHMIETRDLLTLDNVGAVAGAAIRYRFHRLLRDRDGLVRVPGMVVEAVHKLREVRAQLSCELGRLPTRAEVAQAMGVSVEQVRKLEQDAEREQVGSLQAMVGEDGQEPLEINFISLFYQAAVADQERQEALEGMVRQALEAALTEWQREVVVRWYGFGREPQMQKQIAEVFGVTGPAIGQTERSARRKLVVSLAVPYGKLNGREPEVEWYTADQAAAVLGISRYEFTWLIRRGKISRQEKKVGQLACYAREEVEWLAACREEWSA